MKVFGTEYKLRISFHNPTRHEVLLKKAKKYLKKNKLSGNKNLIMAIIKMMSNKDYAIFANPDDEQEFIQCTMDEKSIIVDFPYSVKDKRSRLTHRLEYLLVKHDIRNKPNLLGNKYFYKHSMNQYGCAYEINCRSNPEFAANIMHEILMEVYSLDPEFNMEIKIETWKKFWI